MAMKFQLVFDNVILKQLRKSARDGILKEIIRKMLDKLETAGPAAGNLLDSKLFLYEMKAKHPPVRLYFKHNINANEIYVLEFEIKSSKKDQQRTIDKIRGKTSKT